MDDTRATVSGFLSPIMDFTRELLYANWPLVLENYGEEIPYPEEECMSIGFTWEPMVKGGVNTPQEVTMQLQAFQGFLGSMGIPLTPELIMELINVFMGSLDLPTDMENLKRAAVMAFQQQMQMQGDQQGTSDAYQRGMMDELNGSSGEGASGVGGVQVPPGATQGGQGGGAGLPGFLQQLAG